MSINKKWVLGTAVVGATTAYLWWLKHQKMVKLVQRPLWYSTPHEPADPHTHSNYRDFHLDHLHLSLKVDFANKRLLGYVDVSGTAVSDKLSEVKLDTRNLKIAGVEQNGAKLQFALVEAKVNPGSFGSALVVTLPTPLQKGTKTVLRISYETTPQSEAVQWLAPEQTSGKKHPFLFTQCQAIHARSLLPCQDIPRTKVPYTADISVDHPLSALMSAILVKKHMRTENGVNSMVFSFVQEIPISSYLMALAVGMLQPREIGPRSMVWGEAEVVDIAANEFSETEKFLTTAEDVCGMQYQWKRYDILVLPPSFPYGGMENPCLTFATPTLLAGDRSLAGVIAHEIAHSWTGNLVTNKTWEHFWLNEGCTMYVERRIMEILEGPAARGCQSIVGLEHLKDDVEHMGKDNPLTNLVPNLAGVDPDDAFSSVPYEKGYTFLTYLEREMGAAVFQKFFHSYLKNFKNTPLTTADFKTYLEKYCADNAIKLCVDWYAWTCTPGMPPVELYYDRTNHTRAVRLVEQWVERSDGKDAGGPIPAKTEWEGWSAVHQKVPFLDFLLEHVKTKVPGSVGEKLLEEMDRAYTLTSTKNSEIRFRWQRICLHCGYKPIYSHVVDFITSQGRMKFVRPLYRELLKVQPDLARSTFTKHKSTYHPIAAKMIGQDLNVKL